MLAFTLSQRHVSAVYVKEGYYAPYLCNTQMIEFEANTLTESCNNVQRHKNNCAKLSNNNSKIFYKQQQKPNDNIYIYELQQREKYKKGS